MAPSTRSKKGVERESTEPPTRRSTRASSRAVSEAPSEALSTVSKGSKATVTAKKAIKASKTTSTTRREIELKKVPSFSAAEDAAGSITRRTTRAASRAHSEAASEACSQAPSEVPSETRGRKKRTPRAPSQTPSNGSVQKKGKKQRAPSEAPSNASVQSKGTKRKTRATSVVSIGEESVEEDEEYGRTLRVYKRARITRHTFATFVNPTAPLAEEREETMRTRTVSGFANDEQYDGDEVPRFDTVYIDEKERKRLRVEAAEQLRAETEAQAQEAEDLERWREQARLDLVEFERLEAEREAEERAKALMTIELAENSGEDVNGESSEEALEVGPAADEATEESAHESTGESAQESAQDSSQELAQEAVQQSTEEPAQHSTEESSQESAEEAEQDLTQSQHQPILRDFESLQRPATHVQQYPDVQAEQWSLKAQQQAHQETAGEPDDRDNNAVSTLSDYDCKVFGPSLQMVQEAKESAANTKRESERRIQRQKAQLEEMTRAANSMPMESQRTPSRKTQVLQSLKRKSQGIPPPRRKSQRTPVPRYVEPELPTLAEYVESTYGPSGTSPRRRRSSSESSQIKGTLRKRALEGEIAKYKAKKAAERANAAALAAEVESTRSMRAPIHPVSEEQRADSASLTIVTPPSQPQWTGSEHGDTEDDEAAERTPMVSGSKKGGIFSRIASFSPSLASFSPSLPSFPPSLWRSTPRVPSLPRSSFLQSTKDIPGVVQDLSQTQPADMSQPVARTQPANVSHEVAQTQSTQSTQDDEESAQTPRARIAGANMPGFVQPSSFSVPDDTLSTITDDTGLAQDDDEAMDEERTDSEHVHYSQTVTADDDMSDCEPVQETTHRKSTTQASARLPNARNNNNNNNNKNDNGVQQPRRALLSDWNALDVEIPQTSNRSNGMQPAVRDHMTAADRFGIKYSGGDPSGKRKRGQPQPVIVDVLSAISESPEVAIKTPLPNKTSNQYGSMTAPRPAASGLVAPTPRSRRTVKDVRAQRDAARRANASPPFEPVWARRTPRIPREKNADIRDARLKEHERLTESTRANAERLAWLEANVEIPARKTKRVKIDHLKVIPARLPGDVSGCFRVPDYDSDDEIDVDIDAEMIDLATFEDEQEQETSKAAAPSAATPEALSAVTPSSLATVKPMPISSVTPKPTTSTIDIAAARQATTPSSQNPFITSTKASTLLTRQADIAAAQSNTSVSPSAPLPTQPVVEAEGHWRGYWYMCSAPPPMTPDEDDDDDDTEETDYGWPELPQASEDNEITQEEEDELWPEARRDFAQYLRDKGEARTVKWAQEEWLGQWDGLPRPEETQA